MSGVPDHLEERSKSSEEYGSPRRNRAKAPGHIVELSEYVSDANASTVTPSIVELQNLRFQGSEYYTVEPVRSKPPKVEKRPPKRARQGFQPTDSRNSKRTKTNVLVNVVFLKVGEIDTIKELYEADVYIQAKWREPDLDDKTGVVIDFSELWNPAIVIQNVFGEPNETLWHELQHDDKGHAYIYEMRRIKGKFYETMELNDFPFDIQNLSIVVSSELTRNLVHIIEDKSEVSAIHVDCFSDSQEWDLHDFVELSPLEISSQYTKARQSYPGLLATCCASRRAGFFAWNVLLIVNILNIFAFTTFAVSPTLPQNRLQLSFILLLSSISFRFVTNQNIPKISYLTHLDRYVLTSMVFCGVITFWHAVLSRFAYNTQLQESLDFYAFVLFAIGYFLFQLIFIIVMIYQRHVKLNEMRGKEERYKVRATTIMGDMWGKLRNFTGMNDSRKERRNAWRKPR